MAIDAAEVDAVLEAREARREGLPQSSLEELLGSGGAPAVDPPRVLRLKGRPPQLGLGIEGVEDVATVAGGDLRPLPALLRSCCGPGIFWGAVVRNERIVLLLDADRLRSRAAERVRAEA